MKTAFKFLIAAVSLAMASAASAAVSKPEPLKLSISLKLPVIQPVLKVVSLKDIITKVVNKIDDKPKPVLVAIVNFIKKLPKGNHGGGHGCGCHASKH